MIYKKGDLFANVNSGLILHGCNAQGVMGSGFAKPFREKYPSAYDIYVADIKTKDVTLGGVSWCFLYHGLLLGSAITQEFYGKDGRKYVSYDAIDSCMRDVISEANYMNYNIHMPKIGSVLGGGDWSVISNIIISSADKMKYDHNRITVWEL